MAGALLRATLAGIVLLLGCRQPLTSGNATLTLSPDGTTLTFQRGQERLLTFGADAFQLGTVGDLTTGGPSFDPYWLSNASAIQPAGLKWRQLPANGKMKLVSQTARQLTIEVDSSGASVRVVFTAEAPNRFSALMTGAVNGPDVIGYMRLHLHAGATEAFYGMGEWGDTVNHRGKYRPMQIEPGNLETGDNEDHIPVPLLIGTNGWGLFVQSKRPGGFDIASQSDTTIEVTYGTAEQSNLGLQFHLFSEPQPLDIQKHYFDITGYPRLPAPWALGPLLWRNHKETTAQVMADIQQIDTIPLATSGIWFDDPYASGIQTFDFNPSQFPDAGSMFQALHDNGLRYGVWHPPYETPAGVNDAAPMQNTYAVTHDFFPPMSSLWSVTNKWSPPIDFTNEAAVTWWQSQLQNYVNLGVEGFKNDYGEDVNVGIDGEASPWVFSDGSTELTMHYGYTLLFHQVYAAMLPASGGWLLARAGRWGDQVHGMIIWPGDLDANMDQQGDVLPNGTTAVGGLPAALAKGMSLSTSGFLFFSSDTGGYRYSPCDNETYIRWTEASSLGTAMETGDSSSQMPWEYADNGRTADSLTQYQRYASLHLRLFPYEWTYAQQIATTGRPIERPFGFAWPALGEHPSDEYLFGDSILVAPIVQHSPSGPDSAPPPMSRTVFLPPGSWLNWWDGTPHDGGHGGGRFTETADIDTLPLYIAAGGIVPMLRDTVQTLAPVASGVNRDSFANDSGVLWIRVAPGPSKTSFTVYDGATITQAPAGRFPTLTFAPGKAPVFTRGAQFELIATAQPASVSAGGADLPQLSGKDALADASQGWFWETATGGTLWIKIAGATTVTIR
jgi:alpha-D-xyloside xylohydrolase